CLGSRAGDRSTCNHQRPPFAAIDCTSSDHPLVTQGNGYAMIVSSMARGRIQSGLGQVREGTPMERKKASDFPQELLNLFDGYVHGGISRRAFFDGAQKFAVGGLTTAALFQMLKPNYAWAIQVPPDDKRIKAET